MKKLSYIFGTLAILLTNIMCVYIGFSYAKMMYGIKYEGYSAPASVVFLYAIPYLVGIVVCVIIALKLKLKAKEK